MYNINEQDTYKISSGNSNYKVDNKVLIRLYQPIIGAIAVSVYMTLSSEITLNKNNKNDNQISRLLKLLHVSIQAFNGALANLGKVKLLAIRKNTRKPNDYLFKIEPLKSANDFFEDAALKKLLEEKVDANYLEQVRNYFFATNIDEAEYEDVVEHIQTYEEFMNSFLNKYDMLNGNITLEVENEIKRLKNLFNLDFEQIEDALINSVNDDHSIDVKKLNKYVEGKYKTLPKKEDLSSSFENINPVAYYEKLANRTMMPSEINQLNALKEKYDFSNGVINVSIDYYFKYGNSQTKYFPDKYFDKVFNSLKERNCKTVQDAMDYFKSIKKNNNENIKIEEKKEKKETEVKELDEETLAALKELADLVGD